MILYSSKHRKPFRVDEDASEAVGHYTWRVHSKGYPMTSIGKTVPADGRRSRPIFLHQFLFGFAPKGLMWDHINRNKLDNRRCNLRLVSATENRRNSGLSRNNTSGIKGVSRSRGRWWQAMIGVGRTYKHLGRFETFAAAATARQVAERELWR